MNEHQPQPSTANMNEKKRGSTVSTYATGLAGADGNPTRRDLRLIVLILDVGVTLAAPLFCSLFPSSFFAHARSSFPVLPFFLP